MDIRPPAGCRHFHRCALAVHRKAQPLEGGADLLLLQPDAAELLHLCRCETDDGLGLGRSAGDLALGGRAAGDLQHHGGGEIEAGQDERRVDAALEAVAGVALHAGLAARRGGAQRREVGALDQHILGVGRAAGVLPAQDAAEAQHGAVIGDHAHGLVDRVRLAVEACEFLALATEPGTDGADELVGIVDVEWAAAIEIDVVGDVDQRVDGAQTDGLEALLHPGGRGAVGHALDVAAGEAGAGVARDFGEFELDVDRGNRRCPRRSRSCARA